MKRLVLEPNESGRVPHVRESVRGPKKAGEAHQPFLARISHRHRFSAGIDGSVALLPFLWAVGWWSAIISGVRGAVWG
jgi:hypothetical protein